MAVDYECLIELEMELPGRYGHPELSSAIVRPIFGGSGARVYGLRPEQMHGATDHRRIILGAKAAFPAGAIA